MAYGLHDPRFGGTKSWVMQSIESPAKTCQVPERNALFRANAGQSALQRGLILFLSRLVQIVIHDTLEILSASNP